MPRYHRYYLPGHPVFITCVTRDRKPYLSEANDLKLFWESVEVAKNRTLFTLLAYAILPDHFHWLIQPPEVNPNFSTIIKLVKWRFTREYAVLHHTEDGFTPWQNRFWDHVIRDDRDQANHMDYIHWNPVKHGYVKTPEEWTQSSFRSWVEKGYYDRGWGIDTKIDAIKDLDYE